MKGILILTACIVFSASASTFLKLGAVSIRRFDLVSLISNPMIWLGGFFYSAAFVGYILALRLMPLSITQPVITAGVSVVTAFIAVLLFREQMQPTNWAGIFMICSGICFLFAGRG